MDSLSIPPTIFVAFGVITAALLAGFFSFLNLISSKENKVSEFRLAWVDGLREEISIYTAAVQELVRVEDNGLYSHEGEKEKLSAAELNREWYLETREAYARVGESLSRIQLRLNPKHIKENPSGPEAKLMSSVLETRELFNKGYYKEASSFCVDIRDAAAPLLKKTWDQVKKGEPGYRIIRASALTIILAGTILLVGFGYHIAKYQLDKKQEFNQTNESLEKQQPESNKIRALTPHAEPLAKKAITGEISTKPTTVNIVISR